MSALPTTKSLDALLDASRATETFKTAARALAERKPQSAIAANAGLPPVKVLRVTLKLLETLPESPIESLAIEAVSGCSNFTGHAVAQPGALRVDFNWDCAWRARQEGWQDAFGDPDQIRAAQTFGYQCFEKFDLAG